MVTKFSLGGANVLIQERPINNGQSRIARGERLGEEGRTMTMRFRLDAGKRRGSLDDAQV